MGGNALTGLRHTRRYEADEFHKLVPDVLQRMQSVVGPEHRVAVIPAYRSKPSFGDMDVLVEATEGSVYQLKQSLAKAFGVDYIVSDGTPTNQLEVEETAEVAVRTVAQLARSGKNYSFAYRELQVDFLPVSPEAFQSTLNYYSFNDCGNLLGRVVHTFGLKLGQFGLLYPFKSGDYEFTELVVERDWRVVLPAFGWDYDKWAAGFETLEDMFRFVAGSPYFNSDIFQFQNLNAKSRIRDKKRTTYNGFLEWLKTQEPTTLPAYEFTRDKAAYLPLLFERLSASGFQESYARTAREFGDWQEARRRFNGDVVKAHTGLEGKPLANVMKALRSTMGANPQDIQAYVLAHSDEDLRALMTIAHQQLLASSSA